MNIYSFSRFLLLLICFLPVDVIAELHGSLTLTTNNVGRWFSKTQNAPSMQANLDYQHSSGLFLGTTVSNVNYDSKLEASPANVEIIPYMGWSFSLNEEWRLDLHWSRYLYDGNVFSHPADYDEYYLTLNYSDFLTGRISVSNDYYGLGNYALDYEITARFPITDKLQLSSSYGFSQTKDVLGSDYPYWNVGITYFYEFVAFDLRYMDATETNINPNIVEELHEKYDPVMLSPSCVFAITFSF